MNRKVKIDFNRFWILIWGVFFAAIATVLIISVLSQKQTVIDGGIKEFEIKSLSCEVEDYFYPFLAFDDSTRKEFEIVATFDEDNLRSIALKQMLYYDDLESIKRSEGENHAAMNLSFYSDGLEADALGANYAKLSDAMKFGLYGTREDMNDVGMKYFLLESAGGYDYNQIKQVYESLGMSCVNNNV